MRKGKKLIKLLIVFAAVICCLSYHPNSLEADDQDFEDNYDTYCQMCTTKTTFTPQEKETCKAFKEYEERRAAALATMLKEAKDNLSDMKANITAQGAKIAEYNNQIKILEKQIEAINNSILTIETNIEQLNIQIQEREIKIEGLNNQIKERMVASQTNIRTNAYIKFIMGATSFVDLLRRISAINEITAYDKSKIDEMEAEKVLLQADIDELQLQKDNLIVEQANLENKKAGYQNLLEVANELMAEFRLQEAAYTAQMEALADSKSQIDANLNKINNALNTLTASYGFGQFFKSASFWVSTEAWYYSSGGFHGAIDCAVSIGTGLYPVANGVVVDARGGCAYNGGYMGNSCNYGRGNYVFYICQIEDRFYFIQYDHLKDIYVSVGDAITQGSTCVGTTGNSGNSSGAHLHMAITYLGTTSDTSVNELIQKYRNYGNYFGLPNSYAGTCAYRGNKAPCLVNPTDIYGYKYGRWYSVRG